MPVAIGGLLALAACTSTPPADPPRDVGTTAPTPTPDAPAPQETEPPPPAPEPEPVPGPPLGPATAEPEDVLTDLTTPWDLEFLPGGAVLVTLRDLAEVVLLREAGVSLLSGPGIDQLREATRPDGEGGLLGIALHPDRPDQLYLYRTTDQGNQVVRGTLDGAAGTLGPLDLVIGDIPADRVHNGGRIAFGPDGMLWVATGDASVRGAAQDRASLAGKILRVTPDGAPAPDNPDPTSPVWSLGHRNVQGLGWTADGTLVASEFGQNRLDEVNVVTPGGNYGWPLVEGLGGAPEFVDPVVTWATSEASPSGLAVTDDAVWVAALRGQRLWEVPWAGDAPAGEPVAHLVGDLGRIRHVEVGPDGALWLLTQNTDGRGRARAGDDRLVRMLPPGTVSP